MRAFPSPIELVHGVKLPTVHRMMLTEAARARWTRNTSSDGVPSCLRAEDEEHWSESQVSCLHPMQLRRGRRMIKDACFE